MRPIPHRTPLTNSAGFMTYQWQTWFTELRSLVNEIRVEPYVLHTSGGLIYLNDLGKTHIVEVGTSDITLYLPSVDSSDLNKWIRIVRIGTGKLTIVSADNDAIEYSSRPGRIWCDEAKRTAANITLMLVESDTWALLAGFGIWRIV